MYPDPQTQYATYLFDKAYPEKNMISSFEMSDSIYEMLKIFRLRMGRQLKISSMKFIET
jgi:hypothetical protein